MKKKLKRRVKVLKKSSKKKGKASKR